MTRIYEVTAWRPETYTTSDTFKADSPEDALAQAKAAFDNEFGEPCNCCEAWSEFMVSQNGKQVLIESPDQRGGLTHQTDLNTPWSLHLDRDSTEDIAVIRDAGKGSMSTVKHTPGPWHLGKNGDKCAKNHAICAGTTVIAKVYGQGYPVGEGWSEQSQANACLIAVAPELLEALRTVVDMEYDRDVESRNFDEERLEYWSGLIAEAESRAA